MPRHYTAAAPDGTQFEFDWGRDNDPTPDELSQIYTQGTKTLSPPPTNKDEVASTASGLVNMAGTALHKVGSLANWPFEKAQEGVDWLAQKGAQAQGINVPTKGPGSTASEMAASGLGLNQGGKSSALLPLGLGDVAEGAIKSGLGVALNPLTYPSLGGSTLIHRAFQVMMLSGAVDEAKALKEHVEKKGWDSEARKMLGSAGVTAGMLGLSVLPGEKAPSKGEVKGTDTLTAPPGIELTPSEGGPTPQAVEKAAGPPPGIDVEARGRTQEGEVGPDLNAVSSDILQQPSFPFENAARGGPETISQPPGSDMEQRFKEVQERAKGNAFGTPNFMQMEEITPPPSSNLEMTQGSQLLDRPGIGKHQIANVRGTNIMQAAWDKIKTRAALLLDAPEIADIEWRHQGGTRGQFAGKRGLAEGSKNEGAVNFDINALLQGGDETGHFLSPDTFYQYLKNLMTHEPAHANAFHDFARQSIQWNPGGEAHGGYGRGAAELGRLADVIDLPGGVEAEVPSNMRRWAEGTGEDQHTTENMNARAGVSFEENKFQQGNDILKHDPEIQTILTQMVENLKKAKVFEGLQHEPQRDIEKRESAAQLEEALQKANLTWPSNKGGMTSGKDSISKPPLEEESPYQEFLKRQAEVMNNPASTPEQVRAVTEGKPIDVPKKGDLPEATTERGALFGGQPVTPSGHVTLQPPPPPKSQNVAQAFALSPGKTSFDKVVNTRNKGLLSATTATIKSAFDFIQTGANVVDKALAPRMEELSKTLGFSGPPESVKGEATAYMAGLADAMDGAKGLFKEIIKTTPMNASFVVNAVPKYISALAESVHYSNSIAEMYSQLHRTLVKEGWKVGSPDYLREFANRGAEQEQYNRAVLNDPKMKRIPDKEAIWQAMNARGDRSIAMDALVRGKDDVKNFEDSLSHVVSVMDSMKDTPYLGPVMKVIWPFRHVPFVVDVKRPLEYSPLGFLTSVPGRTGAARGEALGRAAIGTSLMMFGLPLIYSGALQVTGGGDPNYKTASEDRTIGMYPYSVRVGNSMVALDKIPIVGLQIGAMADMVDIARRYQALPDEKKNPKEYQVKMKALQDRFWGSIQHAAGGQYLDSLVGLFEAASSMMNSQQGSSGAAKKYASSLVGSVVPGLVKNAANALDPYIKQTRPWGDTFLDPTTFHGIPEPIAAKLPGVSTEMPFKPDMFGLPMEKTSLPPWAKTIEPLWRAAVPFNVHQLKEEAMPGLKELIRLDMAPTIKGTIKKGKVETRLPQDEFSELKKEFGPQILDAVNAKVQTEAYKNASEAAKKLQLKATMNAFLGREKAKARKLLSSEDLTPPPQ